jgi:dihydropteroate synthase
VLVGASRKRFIGQLTGETRPAHRVFGSVGAAVAAYERGASIVRVHDVAATRAALDVAAAIRDAGDAP